jgi:Na+:H+ antiporter, NhaB family
MALRCYPLQPGGLLTIEAVAIGMTSTERVFEETVSAIEVVLLLIFMVAGIYFLKDLLRFTFTRLLTRVRSKVLLALTFTVAAALHAAVGTALGGVTTLVGEPQNLLIATPPDGISPSSSYGWRRCLCRCWL